MIAPASLQRVTGAHPRLLDAALATFAGGLGLLPLLFGRWPDGVHPSGADAMAATAAFLLVLARRRTPLPVLALAVLGEVAFTVIASYPSRVLKMAALIAVYTVARTVRRRIAVIAVSGTALALYRGRGLHDGARCPSTAGRRLYEAHTPGLPDAAKGRVRKNRHYDGTTQRGQLPEEAHQRLSAKPTRITPLRSPHHAYPTAARHQD
ncbi:hypothetical protein OHT57_04630 [Streptomyces sp. NBC_00285]|uniref:DUF7134 domain-containing protein n=1 Tax=Streptomyces sp. NBC_00285 TaxID=2975700 RepID=UPI002E2838C2|nr:hypothetical protein [Streptomyces sp. NBC_00285]